ncbi:unnamed protein product [Paramecium sonneborni]|uniref:Transmembrane protein n=1 Tax=Paramecium sonneborni TaxID=65129 RepID=A0A8S1M1G8_9CILI|nr:unnamed protein product [Paramecium sonneborni]
MIIIFQLFYIVHTLYLLELRQDKIFINLDASHQAYITFQGVVSYIQDENQYLDCPYQLLACWCQINSNIENEKNLYQLKLGMFQVYDDGKHSQNTEIITFFHKFMEDLDDDTQNNFISLNPFSSYFNSFVYYGYSLCISKEDAYLQTMQNEFLHKKESQILGIKSKFYFEESQFSIRISYIQYGQNIFDISNYSIFLDFQYETNFFPNELMKQIVEKSFPNEFQEFQFIDDQLNYFRKSNIYRVDTLEPLKFYNYANQPLIMLPEDYIEYNFKEKDVDILKLAGENQNSKIILGRSFLNNKIIHLSSLTSEIFIEQLSRDICNIQQVQNDSIFNHLISQVSIIFIIIIFFYAIFRKIRAQRLLKNQLKIVESQLILKLQEVEQNENTLKYFIVLDNKEYIIDLNNDFSVTDIKGTIQECNMNYQCQYCDQVCQYTFIDQYDQESNGTLQEIVIEIENIKGIRQIEEFIALHSDNKNQLGLGINRLCTDLIIQVRITLKLYNSPKYIFIECGLYMFFIYWLYSQINIEEYRKCNNDTLLIKGKRLLFQIQINKIGFQFNNQY